MKKILTIIIILTISSQSFACSCRIVPLLERIANSEFVAKAKILNIQPNENDKNLHDIEIDILELYKGDNIRNLKIYSVSNSSCSFFTPENTTWLIFANKNKNGELSFGFCSGAQQLDRKFDSEKYANSKENFKKSFELKLQVLEYLKNKDIEPLNEFDLRVSFSYKCLKNFKGFKDVTERFALYELTIAKDLSLIDVKSIKEFDNDNLKDDLLKCLKESFITDINKKEINNDTKIIIGLYYYSDEKGNNSFIGQLDL